MPEGEDETNANTALVRAAHAMRGSLATYFRKRVRDGSETEDLVQEVFIRIAGRKTAVVVENVERYVFQTAASVITDRARRRGVRMTDAHVPFDPEVHSEEDVDPHRLLSGSEDLRAAATALQSLPARTRAIFLLHRLDGLKYREIASQLGISVSATEKHMARATEHLTATFRKRG